MDMNALMRQAQAMQRQMMKAQRELEEKLFELDSAGGAIHISLYGSKKIESINIDKDAIDPEDKEMLEDMIKVAINEALEMIDKEIEKIQAKFTGGMKMPF
ncbi:MAG: YbaB/EbfC family nucleoid-associated protein [Bacilli bacterium]